MVRGPDSLDPQAKAIGNEIAAPMMLLQVTVPYTFCTQTPGNELLSLLVQYLFYGTVRHFAIRGRAVFSTVYQVPTNHNVEELCIMVK